MYAFSEERAHRIAIQYANQCKHLIVVYCIPTYTTHQRCKYPSTDIISLNEFYDIISQKDRRQFEPQINFLLNHMSKRERYDPIQLLNEINNPKLEVYNIEKAELIEAFSIMKTSISNEYDALYYFAAMNLINAWAGRVRKNKRSKILQDDEKLFKNIYYFKDYITKNLSQILLNRSSGIKVFLEKRDLVIIEIFNFQFSFHHIPINETLENYFNSNENKVIEWNGKRLQPIAPLMLHYSREARRNYYENNVFN